MLGNHNEREDAGEPPQLKILKASWVKLGEHLERAFDSEPARKDPSSERERYIHALYAVSVFLRANNAPLRYAKRWNRLAVALDDANDGKADPLLAPASFGSLNPGNPTMPVVSIALTGGSTATGTVHSAYSLSTYCRASALLAGALGRAAQRRAYLLLITLVTLYGGMLNVMQRFASAAAASIFLNLAMMATLALAAFFPTAGHAAAWGVLISGFLQYFLLAGDLATHGGLPRFAPLRLDEDIRAFFGALAPATVGSMGTQVAMFDRTY